MDQVDDAVQSIWKTKALRAARIAWTHLDGGACSLPLTVDSCTPVGKRCGSSTSDCVAAMRAVGDLVGRDCTADEIARWSIQTDVAADSTMFDLRPIAFRQRHGRVLRTLRLAYPSMRVIAADLGGPPVDIVTRPQAAYSDAELAGFTIYSRCSKTASRAGCFGIARVATESAVIQQRYYPHRRRDEFVSIVRESAR